MYKNRQTMAIIKKTTLLALISLVMAGCDYQNPDGSYDTSKSLMMKTVVIDSCEYISGYYKLAHKGNCRFCKERRQKELEELVIKLKEKYNAKNAEKSRYMAACAYYARGASARVAGHGGKGHGFLYP